MVEFVKVRTLFFFFEFPRYFPFLITLIQVLNRIQCFIKFNFLSPSSSVSLSFFQESSASNEVVIASPLSRPPETAASPASGVNSGSFPVSTIPLFPCMLWIFIHIQALSAFTRLSLSHFIRSLFSFFLFPFCSLVSYLLLSRMNRLKLESPVHFSTWVLIYLFIC